MRIIPNNLQQSVGQSSSQCGNIQVNKQFVQAGRLKFHLIEWEEITSNKFILDNVQEYVIEFASVPIQTSQPKQEDFFFFFYRKELLKSVPRGGRVHLISSIFASKEKWEISHDIEPNNLNKFIPHMYFKMVTLQSCINLMTKNCFMASLDLTDAYYSVSISPDSQKYSKFKVGSQL